MEIILITILIFFASTLGTVTGFGSSTIMLPIMIFTMPLTQALLFVGIIHWFVDIWKMLLFRKGFRWKLVLLFGLSGIIATYLGANLAFSIPEKLLSQVLGSFLLVYVLFILVKPNFKIRQTNSAALTGGVISGFFAGIFGVGGAIRSAFLTAFDLKKATYIATVGAISFIVDTTRIATYIANDATLPPLLIWGLIFFIPASFFGSFTAKKIVNHIPQQKFRIVIAIFILLVALKFLLLPN